MKTAEVTKLFRDAGISLTEKQAHQFVQFYDLLIEWNGRMNLTAITESEEVLVKHFLDSVISYKVIDYSNYNTLIDVGTGAGFPGIPIKIVYPHLQVTLVDALNKRIKFIEEVVDKLELNGIEAIHGRAEDLGRTSLRDQFDLCVSRAVSQLNVLCEYCMPFIRPGGQFISYKGNITVDELESSKKAIELLGGHLNNVTEQLPLMNGIKRQFVIIDKISPTDKKYPRRAGKPSKNPL